MGKLMDTPDYVYDLGQVACPECYRPVSQGRADGRCDLCLHDKSLLPVNYKRRPKKKDDDEDEQYSDRDDTDDDRPRRSKKNRDY